MNIKPDLNAISQMELGELKEQIELISESVHSAWAESRTSTGWTYGKTYDLNRKKHPSLVPYDSLSQGEKDVDRATVEQTIRTLLWLGYTIQEENKK